MGPCCPPHACLLSETHLVDTTRVPGAHHKLLGEPYGRAMEVYAPVWDGDATEATTVWPERQQGCSTVRCCPTRCPYVMSWALS